MAASRLIAVSLACMVLAGCDSDASEPAGSYVYDAGEDTITASAPGDAGDTTMLSGPAIAAPLPVDIPIIPGAEVTKATHVASPDGLRIALVELISEQSPAEVAEYYRTAAANAGLSSALDLAGSKGMTFIAIGEDRSRMTLHAAPIRIAPDGTRAPEPPEDAYDNPPSNEGEAQPTYRSVTSAQLYIIGKAPPVAEETPPAP